MLTESLESYHAVVLLDNLNREAWLDYAETLFEAKRMEDALEAYSRAQKLQPDHPESYFRQAKALLALGRSDESIRSLKIAFDLDPQKKEEFAHTYPELYRDARIRNELGLDRS